VRHTPLLKSELTLTLNLYGHTSRGHSQDLQAPQGMEGPVWEVGDVVEAQGESLEGRQAGQSSHRHLGEPVIVHPQVAQGPQTLEAPTGQVGQEVGIQTPGRGPEKPLKYSWTLYLNQHSFTVSLNLEALPVKPH